MSGVRELWRDEWNHRRVSRTCEVAVRVDPYQGCGKPAVAAYPTAGDDDFMALCAEHAPPRADITMPVVNGHVQFPLEPPK